MASLVLAGKTIDADMVLGLKELHEAGMGGGYLDAADRYMRLALKAQSQCRTTLQTLGELKYPRETAFIRQQNVAVNQQVNNGTNGATSAGTMNDPRTPAREKFSNLTNQLLENHHERLDIGAPIAAVGADPTLETVGAVERAENGER